MELKIILIRISSREVKQILEKVFISSQVREKQTLLNHIFQEYNKSYYILVLTKRKFKERL